MDKSVKDLVYVDFPMKKEITKTGELKILKNNEALSQSIKIWISTQFGEKIRTLTGGCLIKYIGKPLDDFYAEEIKSVLKYGLEQRFTPNITILDLKVIPNKEKNRWEIYIVGYNIELSLGVNDYVFINNK